MHIIKKEFRFVSNLQFALFNETNIILTMVSNKSLGCEITNWAGSCCCLIQLELHGNKVEAKGCSKGGRHRFFDHSHKEEVEVESG